MLQNNTQMVIWKDDNFTGDAWKTSFEGRYPDKNTDTTRLAAFSSWLKSTDTTAVSTDEEKAERLAKFKNEFEDWCNVDAMLFNYIFTEVFLMVDNRAKNAFPKTHREDTQCRYAHFQALCLSHRYDASAEHKAHNMYLQNGQM